MLGTIISPSVTTIVLIVLLTMLAALRTVVKSHQNQAIHYYFPTLKKQILISKSEKIYKPQFQPHNNQVWNDMMWCEALEPSLCSLWTAKQTFLLAQLVSHHIMLTCLHGHAELWIHLFPTWKLKYTQCFLLKDSVSHILLTKSLTSMHYTADVRRCKKKQNILSSRVGTSFLLILTKSFKLEAVGREEKKNKEK